MKFSELKFGKHQNWPQFSNHAVCEFPNGYGASIVTGECAYSDEDHLYELAVLENGKLTYKTHITDDVLGYLTESDVERILGEIEALS